jgi:hypothetical protein
VLVREVGERPPDGFAPRRELLGRDQQRGHEAAAEEQDAHDERRRQQEPAGAADAALRPRSAVAGIALDEGHHDHAGLEPRQAERQLGEQQQ